MLDKVHVWDRRLTKIYLDEELLTMQHNAGRSHLKNREYYLPAVPPIPHLYPSKSKTSFQTSVFNSNWGRIRNSIHPTHRLSTYEARLVFVQIPKSIVGIILCTQAFTKDVLLAISTQAKVLSMETNIHSIVIQAIHEFPHALIA
ncbi:hypothetical protein EDD18DRAFT_1114813 [Armillaria luteobubalina]|uniref:Uncharacterized protein n=1 Tax=Armillaria luteobubalina TaxID=153913 RepID=A0AA39U480_9AGAR|nr:hypothetical protein EDD18DRAFT_1114813 [Armillaria luteobubalina]